MISIVDIDARNISRFQMDILEIEKSSFPSPWSANGFREEINRPVSHLWGLITGESFAGYICFWMFAGEIHLMNIAIHPEKRGKGLGLYLLIKMVEKGKFEGIDTVWLEVRPSNIMARMLYEKMGFKETGRRLRYYTDTCEDAIVMTLSLVRNMLDPPGTDVINRRAGPCTG